MTIEIREQDIRRVIPGEGIVLVIVIECCPALTSYTARAMGERRSRRMNQGDAVFLARAAEVDQQPLLLLHHLVPPLVLLASARSRAVVPGAGRAHRRHLIENVKQCKKFEQVETRLNKVKQGETR